MFLFHFLLLVTATSAGNVPKRAALGSLISILCKHLKLHPILQIGAGMMGPKIISTLANSEIDVEVDVQNKNVILSWSENRVLIYENNKSGEEDFIQDLDALFVYYS